MIFRLIRWFMFGFILQALGVLAIGGLIVYSVFFADFNLKETADYWKNKIWQTKIDISIEKEGQETNYSLSSEDIEANLEKY